jgi:flagellar biosynthesis protein FlhB
MADASGEDRTEQASARRLAQARSEGQIPLGRDAAMVAGLAGVLVALAAAGAPLRDGLGRLLADTARTLPETPFASLPSLAAGPALLGAAVCAAGAAAAAIAALAQTRGGFWPHLAAPDLSRLLRGGGLSRVFSKQLLVDLLAAAVKVVALCWAAWSGARGGFVTLGALVGAPEAEQLAAGAALVGRVAWRLLAVCALLAGADVALQRHRFFARMRMTKDEQKREAKEEEGDPMLRGRRKARHRELAKQRARVEVPRADALLVNPTHVAVALRYRRDEGRAPRVTAKGKGALAEHMRELARAHAVPIVQDVPLARLLYRRVKVGREVPAETFKAVAAVLAFVYRLTGRAQAGRESA